MEQFPDPRQIIAHSLVMCELFKDTIHELADSLQTGQGARNRAVAYESRHSSPFSLIPPLLHSLNPVFSCIYMEKGTKVS